MWKDTSHGHGQDVSWFAKDRIIGMHQAKKTSKKIAETTKIGLRTGRIVGTHRLQGGNKPAKKS